jgi:hypothetical protein
MEKLYFYPKFNMIIMKGDKDATVRVDTVPGILQKVNDEQENLYWPMVINPDTNQIWYVGAGDCLYPVVFERELPLPFVSRERLRDYKYHVCFNLIQGTFHYHKGDNPNASNCILGQITALKRG